jgi:hypothetical protein
MSTPARNRVSNKIGTYVLTFNHDDVVRLLKAAVEHEGSQRAYARHHGVDRVYLNQILRGKKPVGPTFLKALGLQNAYAKAGNADQYFSQRSLYAFKRRARRTSGQD